MGIIDLKTVRLAFGLALALSVAPTAQAATLELVTNGGFETGDASGWNIGPDSSGTGISSLEHSGAFSYEIGLEHELSQTLATEMGTLYNISFWIMSLDSVGNSFSVSFGGTPLVSVTDMPFSPLFQQYSFGYVAASSSSDQLVFNFAHYSNAFLLDDVSVSAVPVPGALPLLLAGLGGLGFVGRRSRKKSA